MVERPRRTESKCSISSARLPYRSRRSFTAVSGEEEGEGEGVLLLRDGGCGGLADCDCSLALCHHGTLNNAAELPMTAPNRNNGTHTYHLNFLSLLNLFTSTPVRF